jgi:hypothetical protein
MKRILSLMGFLGALLLSSVAFGADGDECDSHVSDARIPLARTGNWAPTVCIQLCDDKAASHSACDEWDFNDTGGMPDIIVLEYEEDPSNMDCSGTPDYTFTTGPITGGVPSYAIDTTALVMNPTTNRVIIVTKDSVMDRFLFTAIADDGACTDVDIRMFLYNRKKGS